MQMKLAGGYVMVTGIVRKEPERTTTNNGKENVRCSLVIDLKRNGDGSLVKGADGYSVSVWVNLRAWGAYAAILGGARFGDGILAVGKVREWEYEGKQFRELVINDDGFLSVSFPITQTGGSEAPQEPPALVELDDNDGELPF